MKKNYHENDHEHLFTPIKFFFLGQNLEFFQGSNLIFFAKFLLNFTKISIQKMKNMLS